ncbi:hypothetical protein PMIT1303_01265 [Prochlorococcus sp. MIT 1303]|nr:hypothetical protein PMIT1303_01265 [Prochlorococcus sp. MIT 1303]
MELKLNKHLTSNFPLRAQGKLFSFDLASDRFKIGIDKASHWLPQHLAIQFLGS